MIRTVLKAKWLNDKEIFLYFHLGTLRSKSLLGAFHVLIEPTDHFKQNMFN